MDFHLSFDVQGGIQSTFKITSEVQERQCWFFTTSEGEKEYSIYKSFNYSC
jgi:hypothetical protein